MIATRGGRPGPIASTRSVDRCAARPLERRLRAAAAAAALAALVAGVPWALWQFVGWPLLGQFPTWTELHGALFAPVTAGLLIDVLACVSWAAWGIFALDVVLCTRDLTRGIRRDYRLTSLQGLAALLVGAVVLVAVGTRASPSPHGRDLPDTPAAPSAAALAWRAISVSGPPPEATAWIEVRAPDPRTGVHDSLWRIATRTLGSGARWPEIFQLNRGKPQPGGGTFTRPELVYPGEELALPPPTPAPSGPAPTLTPVPGSTTQNGRAEPAPSSASLSSRIGDPGAAAPQTPAALDASRNLGVAPEWSPEVPAWNPDVFAGLGLAAAISSVMALARLRRRRHYRPGSGARDDLLTGPIVYPRRLAHPDAHTEPRHPVRPTDAAGADLEVLTGTPPPDGVEPPPPHPIPVPTTPPESALRQGRQDAAMAANIRIDDPNDVPSDPPSSAEEPLCEPALQISVLGHLRVLWRGPHVEHPQEITGWLQPRSRELLLLLALHPEGISREVLTTTLWPDATPDRGANSLNTALTRLRQRLAAATHHHAPDIITAHDGRITLDPAAVQVDYWHFDAALAQRRSATTDATRAAAHQLIVDTYGGELAEGLAIDWIEPAREAVRRDAIDAVAALARALVTVDPQRTLDLLEIARAFDPYNEMLYRDIMRLQGRLGHLDAIPRTLALLATRLSDIDDEPTPATVDLASRLQHRDDDDQNRDNDQTVVSETRAG